MKVAVTGKGGVGKTTVSASLARCWKRAGRRVVAVDADPDANLASILGYRGEEITPLVGMKSLIEERVGGGQGWGGFLRMNPRVDDIPERFSRTVDGVRLLVMGSIERGRRGCACPENVLLKEVLNHLLLKKDEHLVVDMEAGVEHLGRGTAEGVDCMIVVVEPGWASLQTAERVARLGLDLGIGRIVAVANKIADQKDEAFVRENMGDLRPRGSRLRPQGLPLPLLGMLPRDPGLEEEAREGSFSLDRPFHQEIERIALDLVGEKGE